MRYYMLILMLVIAGCASTNECTNPYIQVGKKCCLDVNQNGECDVYETVAEPLEQKEEPMNVSANKTTPRPTTSAKSMQSLNVTNLMADINEVLEADLNWQADGDNYKGNLMKYYVITGYDEPVTSPLKLSEALDSWQGYIYFLNETGYDLLSDPVTDIDSAQLQNDYNLHATRVHIIDSEQSFDVANGVVLEHQYLLWEQDNFGHYEGNYDDNLLMYKIHCTPDHLIILRPRTSDLALTGKSQTLQQARLEWSSIVRGLRDEYLSKSNSILARCPVERDFFDRFSSYQRSQTSDKRYFYRLHLLKDWNLSVKIDPLFTVSELNYLLESVNLTLQNNDHASLGPITLDLTVRSDLGDSYRYVVNKKLTGVLKSNGKLERVIHSDDEPKFRDHFFVDVTTYSDLSPVRPRTFKAYANGSVESVSNS